MHAVDAAGCAARAARCQRSASHGQSARLLCASLLLTSYAPSEQRRLFATHAFKAEELAELAPLLRFLLRTSVLPARFRIGHSGYRVAWRSKQLVLHAWETPATEGGDAKSPVDAAWVLVPHEGGPAQYHEITLGDGGAGAPQQTPCEKRAWHAPRGLLCLILRLSSSAYVTSRLAACGAGATRESHAAAPGHRARWRSEISGLSTQPSKSPLS